MHNGGFFQGNMPPNSIAEAGGEFASGVQAFGPLPNATPLPSLSEAIGVVSGTWKHAKKRTITLGVTPDNYPGSGPFPTGGATVSQAGIVNAAGVQFGGATTLRLACILEYGVGSASQKVICDWKAGTYNLPPCQFVRISALPWGTNWSANAGTLAAAVAEGELYGAPVPTVTGYGALTAATAQSFNAPAYARAFDFWPEDNTTTPVMTARFLAAGAGVQVQRNYATGAFFPGWSPIEFYASTISLISDVDTAAILRWYLSL